MSLALRAVIAVLLMIGFYLLALGIAGTLIAIPVLEMMYTNHLHLKLAAICVILGLVVLWSILPRFDNFEAPGPRLTKKEHPRLFKMIEEVARAAEQPVPHDVYLVMDVNAWVAHRGGIMGFGSRPVMGLGLPLMQALTEEEVRAVIAHEFGHYHAGDTKLGPWIFKTRAAIGRTLQSLGDDSWLQKPFLLYGNFFLRVTHAISRAQEFCADAVAARIAGARHVVSSLRRVHGASMAFNAYWQNEVSPVLGAGFRPPLAHGFSRFMGAQNIGEAVEKALGEEMESTEYNPYDTHPPLRERVKAVEAMYPGSESSGRSAIELLDNVEQLEQELLAFMASEAEVRKLKAIDWESIADKVLLPQWKKLLGANAEILKGTPFAAVNVLCENAKTTVKSLRHSDGKKPDLSHVVPLTCSLFSVALALRLIELGGTLDAPPGAPIRVHYNGQAIEPFKILAKGHAEPRPDLKGLKADVEASGLGDVILG